ncbi:hypothetical protein ACWEQN_42710 [Streptomyces sp. NPDC004129]
MRETTCAVCAEPFNGQPAYLVQGARWIRRRWRHGKLLICKACHDSQRGHRNNDFRALPVSWTSLAGRGEQMPLAPCTACGHPVVRNADPGLKRVTCSAGCSTSFTRIRNGNRGSGQPCGTCGELITTGRADSRYCSAQCRQKAYRQRISHTQAANAS